MDRWDYILILVALSFVLLFCSLGCHFPEKYDTWLKALPDGKTCVVIADSPSCEILICVEKQTKQKPVTLTTP
jgi:hypothetical protein